MFTVFSITLYCTQPYYFARTAGGASQPSAAPSRWPSGVAQRGPVPPALRDNVRPGYRSTSFKDSTGCQQASAHAVTRPLDMARQLAAVACGWSEGGSVTFCDGHTAHLLTLASAAGRLSRVWGKRDLTDALAPVTQRNFLYSCPLTL